MICCKISLVVLLIAVHHGATTTHDLWQHDSPEYLDLTGESLAATSTADQTGEFWAPFPEDPAPPVGDAAGQDDTKLMLKDLNAGELNLSLQQVAKEMDDYNTALRELTRELSQNLGSGAPQLITQQTLLDDIAAMEAELRDLDRPAETAVPAEPTLDERRSASEEMEKLQSATSLATAAAERVGRLRKLEEENRRLTEQSRSLTARNAQLKQAAQSAANPPGHTAQQVQDESTKRQQGVAQALAEPHDLHEKSVQDEFTKRNQGVAQAVAEQHDLLEKSVQCASVLRAAHEEISKQESLHEQLQSGIQKLRGGVPERQLEDTMEKFFARRQELVNATAAFQHRESEIFRKLGSVVEPLKALQATPTETPRGSMFLARGSREHGPRGSPGDSQRVGHALRRLRAGMTQARDHQPAAVGTLLDEATSLLSMP